MDPKFAVYVLVVEDTNEIAEEIGQLGASSVDAILDIDTETHAGEVAADMTLYGQSSSRNYRP